MNNKFSKINLLASLLILLSFFLLPQLSSAKTTQINDFDDLMKNLNRGENVKVVVHYGDCKLISDNEVQDRSPQAIGGMNIQVYEYFAPGVIGNPQAFVVFSHSSLINYRGFLFDYVKFKVYKDNKVTITAQYADPRDYEIEMNEKFFSEINNGNNQGAVYFYRVE